MGVKRKTPHYIGQGGLRNGIAGENNLRGGGGGSGVGGNKDPNAPFQHPRANNNNNNNNNNHNNFRQQRAAEAEQRLAAQEHAAAFGNGGDSSRGRGGSGGGVGGGGGGGGWGLYFEESALDNVDYPLNSNNQNFYDPNRQRGVASMRDDLVPTSSVSEEQWQYSALTLLLAVVSLSALFLHVISDAQKSTYRKSRSSTSNSNAYFDHRNYTTSFGVPKQQQEQQQKQKVRKKKTDEWNNDDEDESDKPPHATTAAAVATTTTTSTTSAAARLMMYHPNDVTGHQLQPPVGPLQQHRHRKLSMSTSVAAKEPSAFQPKNYYLNSAGGAMIAAYKSPSSTARAPRPLNDDHSNIIHNMDHLTGTAAIQGFQHHQRPSEDPPAHHNQQQQQQPVLPYQRTTTLNPQILSPASSFESCVTTTTSSDPTAQQQQQHDINEDHNGKHTSNNNKRATLKLDVPTVPQSPHHQSPVFLTDLTPTRISQLLLSPGTDDITPPTKRKTPVRLGQQRHSNDPMMDGTPRVANLRPIYNTSRFLKTTNTMDDSLKPPSFPSASSPHLPSDNNFNNLKLQHLPQPTPPPPLPPSHLLLPPQLTLPLQAPQPDAPQPQQQQQRPYETISGSAAGAFKFASPPSRSPRKTDIMKKNSPSHRPDPFDVIENARSAPFVPCFDVHVAAQPQPKSVNVDDLHLYQMMESGNVSHWEARVAEESRRLQDQIFSNGNNRSSPNPQLDRSSLLSFDSLDAGSGGGGCGNVSETSSDYDCNSIPSNDVRKSIQHKRPDLTISTDSASCLQGAIQFSELRLVEVIGGGGFGQVWKAMWRGTPVAVKVLTGSAQSKNVAKPVLEEFVAEINLLKGMRHPNICLYMGACLDPPNRAIITELAANGSLWDALRLPLMPPYVPCDGISRDSWPSSLYSPDSRHGAPPSMTTLQSSVSQRLTSSQHGGMTTLQTSQSGGGTSFLQQRMSSHPIPPRGSWPWDLVKRVACGAARGMAYLHSGKPPVLHRDLKSANILLDESYTAKVCDFGLSRLKAQGKDSMTANVGTVQWMAPEVLANLGYNEKADVYSFGIICWELLSRQCPFDGMTAIQCALAVLNRNQRPEIPKWCPPSLHALIRACIKKNPDERPTFVQILQALDSMP